MKKITVDRERISGAWQGRISGCILGKPLELISILQGHVALKKFLEKNGSLPLRDYVPFADDPLLKLLGPGSCRGKIQRAEPDDDINYSVLALMMLEKHGLELTTAKVAHSWLRLLPAGATFTAERAAYRTLLNITDDTAFLGLPLNLDLSPCADNQWSEWIGAQIRADLYGWVLPGRPDLAADLARRDASLSHTGAGVHGAMFVAALGAAIPGIGSIEQAIEAALAVIPKDSAAAEAVTFGRSLSGKPGAVDKLHAKYRALNPVHTLNNLALVIWALLSNPDDFSAAIGEAVAAGWDTDCNGATVGGLWGLSGKLIPEQWTAPWQGRVAVELAGVGELKLSDLAERTVAVAMSLTDKGI